MLPENQPSPQKAAVMRDIDGGLQTMHFLIPGKTDGLYKITSTFVKIDSNQRAPYFYDQTRKMKKTGRR